MEEGTEQKKGRRVLDKKRPRSHYHKEKKGHYSVGKERGRTSKLLRKAGGLYRASPPGEKKNSTHVGAAGKRTLSGTQLTKGGKSLKKSRKEGRLLQKRKEKRRAGTEPRRKRRLNPNAQKTKLRWRDQKRE